MIASLEGIVALKEEDRVVLEIAGIGYEVRVTPATVVALKVGARVRLHTVEVTREDGRDLYGFADAESKALFRRLIAVSGVGPKTALLVISIGSVGDVRAAIDAGDVTRLTAVPGVGAKTAQKIILELRGKLAFAESGADRDAVEALVSLGYSRNEAAKALSAVPMNVEGEEQRIRTALKLLGKRK